jgi:hypothetical protein
MNSRRHVALYRNLSRFYPQAFRHEYGEDLLTAFALQLSELGAVRCWTRTTRDLVKTIPTLQMEEHMKTPKHLPAACIAVAVGTTMAAALIGTSLYGAVLLVVAILAAALGALARTTARPVLALERSSSWKPYLAIGIPLLAILIVLMNLPANKDQELSSVGWFVLMSCLMLGFTLVVVGLVLGAAALTRRHRT